MILLWPCKLSNQALNVLFIPRQQTMHAATSSISEGNVRSAPVDQEIAAQVHIPAVAMVISLSERKLHGPPGLTNDTAEVPC